MGLLLGAVFFILFFVTTLCLQAILARFFSLTSSVCFRPGTRHFPRRAGCYLASTVPAPPKSPKAPFTRNQPLAGFPCPWLYCLPPPEIFGTLGYSLSECCEKLYNEVKQIASEIKILSQTAAHRNRMKCAGKGACPYGGAFYFFCEWGLTCAVLQVFAIFMRTSHKTGTGGSALL